MEQKKIRIFISSPSDVQKEREVARRVITDLNLMFSKYAVIEAVMWEDLPLTVDATFQEGINVFLKEEPIDFAVFILWSRLGTPLNNTFVRTDGSIYQSGTEYEYDLMCALRTQKGYPDIMAYVKTDKPEYNNKGTKEWWEQVRQHKAVKEFIERRFSDEETNSNYAYIQFDENVSFENKLRGHLKELIRRKLNVTDDIKEWNGNPYVGLNSFEFDQKDIFFGRGQLIYDTLQNLKKDDGLQSLIVLGESGSGKSSFVKAGLLPMLCKDKQRDYCIVSPSKFAGNIYSGMLDLLVEKYDFLRDDAFIGELRQSIDKNTNFEVLRDIIKKNNGVDTIFYIDQFEELFTDARITKEERHKVSMLLKGLASTHSIPLFISMRVDFCDRFFRFEELKSIKDQSYEVFISGMGQKDIAEVVEKPAIMACLKWEIDADGKSLNEQIIEDAAEIKDLPLIEFALSELYNRRDENDCLTFQSYREIGGMKGAIVEYANNFYNSLSNEEKKALSDLLGYVIAQQRGRSVRKTSLIEDIPPKSVYRSVIKKLVDAHIFVTSKDYQNKPTISIVHEILIEQWEVIVKWKTEYADFLQSNTYYEHRANRWMGGKKSSKDLIQDREALLEAEYFVYKYNKLMGSDTRKFLLTSLKKDVRKNVVWQSLLTCVLLWLFIELLEVIVYDREYYVRDLYRDALYTITSLLIIFLPILIYDVFMKLRAEVVFKTINVSSQIWLAPVILAVLLIWGFDFDSGVLLFATPILIKFISIWRDWWIRHKWKKVKMIKYNRLDRILYRSNSIMFVSALSLFGVFYVAQSKNALDDTTEVADELFSVMNNDEIASDVKYSFSEGWLAYLDTYFCEQIHEDTVKGDRELQYAVSLYNLGRPDNANVYLDAYSDDCQHRVWVIKCKMAEGKFNEAEYFLEVFVKDLDNWIDEIIQENLNVLEIIWFAEKLGRFDLAERFFEILDMLGVDTTSSEYDIKRGHIYLAQNDKMEAIKYYKNGLEENPFIGLKDDFNKLNYFNSIDCFLLNDVIKTLAREGKKEGQIYSLLFEDFTLNYATNDTSFTSCIYEQIQGVWVNTSYENGITYKRQITIDPEKSFITIDIIENYSVLYTYISHVRFEWVFDGIVWCEYDPIDDEIRRMKFDIENDNYFIISSFDDENTETQGMEFVFTRV